MEREDVVNLQGRGEIGDNIRDTNDVVNVNAVRETGAAYLSPAPEESDIDNAPHSKVVSPSPLDRLKDKVVFPSQGGVESAFGVFKDEPLWDELMETIKRQREEEKKSDLAA